MDKIRILAIDDEVDILEIYKDIFTAEKQDYEIVCFDNPLNVTLEDFQKAHVVICDYKMPGITGTEVLENMYSAGLELPFIFVTGYEGELTKNIRVSSIIHTLKKPFSPQDLILAVDTLAHYQMEWENQLKKLLKSTDFNKFNEIEFLEFTRKTKSLKFIRGINTLNSLMKKNNKN